jgi:hypothetical protein
MCDVFSEQVVELKRSDSFVLAKNMTIAYLYLTGKISRDEYERLKKEEDVTAPKKSKRPDSCVLPKNNTKPKPFVPNPLPGRKVSDV